MKRPERIVLVTGAPRSGTTPVGDLLARVSGARMLYEPMGPNGDTAIADQFVIPGAADFTAQDLAGFVERMAGRRLQMSAVTRRKAAPIKMALVYRILGTQAQHSYRKFRFDPFVRTLVWKDPFAAFCAEFGGDAGYRSVMTVRPPLAHAASYKRMGWVSRVADVYPRYVMAFGEIEGFCDLITRFGDTPLGSGALMWRLVHTRFATMPKAKRASLYLLDMEALGQDEVAGYRQVFDWLGLEMPRSAHQLIAARSSRGTHSVPGQVHDFERSAQAANSAWQRMLTPEEIELVQKITGDLWDALPCDNR